MDPFDLGNAIDSEFQSLKGITPQTVRSLTPQPNYSTLNLGDLGGLLSTGLNAANSSNLGSINSFNNNYLTKTFSPYLNGGEAGNKIFDVAGGNGGGENGGGGDYNLSTFGKVNAGLQTLGNMMSAWNGYQQTKVAKKQLAFQKDAFNKQYGAQKSLTNSQLEDRQRRRVMDSADNMSVASYMDKYGIK